jgi:hypothetical protein
MSGAGCWHLINKASVFCFGEETDRQIGEAGKDSKQAVWRGNTWLQGCKLTGLVCVCIDVKGLDR